MYPPEDDSETSSYDTPSKEFYVGPRKSHSRMFFERYLPIAELVVGMLSQFGFFATWIWAFLQAARFGTTKYIFLTILLPGVSQIYWSYRTFGSPFSYVCIGVALLLLLSLVLSRISQSRLPHA